MPSILDSWLGNTGQQGLLGANPAYEDPTLMNIGLQILANSMPRVGQPTNLLDGVPQVIAQGTAAAQKRQEKAQQAAAAGALLKAIPGITDEQRAALGAVAQSDPSTVTSLGGNLIASGLKPKTTDDLLEYDTYRRQELAAGRTPDTFTNWMRGNKAAGATNVNVNPGERSQEQVLGKNAGDQYVSVINDSVKARGNLSTLNQMEALTQEPNFYSGAGSGLMLQGKRILSRWTGDPSLASSTETFNALAKRVTLDQIGGTLGAQISDGDRRFIEAVAPNLDNTPEGNRQLISIQRKLEQRKIEVAKLAQANKARNGGKFNYDEFVQELGDFAESNPLFPQAAAPQPPASGATPRTLPPGVTIKRLD